MHISFWLRPVVASWCVLALCGAALAQSDDETPPGDDVPAAASTVEDAVERLENGRAFGAWRLTCEALAVNETACVLSQRLIQRDGNRFLAELALFPAAGEDERAFIAARVPIGVYFPSGFVMRLGESETRYEFDWQACDRDRCEALLTVTPEIAQELEDAGSGVVGYRPAVDAEPLVFQVSTSGANEGLSALRAAQ